MTRWKMEIFPFQGEIRTIPLEHEYDTEEEAAREAEDIADQEFTENDDGWALFEVQVAGASEVEA